MSTISALPYDVLYQIETYLPNEDLLRLIEAFNEINDKSLIFITYFQISRKHFIISDSYVGERNMRMDHIHFSSIGAIAYLTNVINFDIINETHMIPRLFQIEIEIPSRSGNISTYVQLLNFLKDQKYANYFTDKDFDFIFRINKDSSPDIVNNFLNGVIATLGPKIKNLSIITCGLEIDMKSIAKFCCSLRSLKLQNFDMVAKVSYIPSTIYKLELEGTTLDGRLLPAKTNSLRLGKVDFNHSSTIILPYIENLNIYHVRSVANFIENNLSNTLCSLHLEDIELMSAYLDLRELLNLKDLELIDISGRNGYYVQFPQSLDLLIIQDKYLPFIAIDFNSLSQNLRCLTLRGNLPYRFHSIQYPINLKSLTLQGGGGTFYCEKFRCPPGLNILVITLQEFRNIHKLRLPVTTREVNLSSNKIRKIANIKFPSNIEKLSLSNNSFGNINHVEFPINMKQIDLTQLYSLTGQYDFRKYCSLCIANIFISESNNFTFNKNVKVINDYDWRVDLNWKNRDLNFFYLID